MPKQKSSPFLFSGGRGKASKRQKTAAMKKMMRAKRKAAKKAKGCEFC